MSGTRRSGIRGMGKHVHRRGWGFLSLNSSLTFSIQSEEHGGLMAGSTVGELVKAGRNLDVVGHTADPSKLSIEGAS